MRLPLDATSTTARDRTRKRPCLFFLLLLLFCFCWAFTMDGYWKTCHVTRHWCSFVSCFCTAEGQASSAAAQRHNERAVVSALGRVRARVLDAVGCAQVAPRMLVLCGVAGHETKLEGGAARTMGTVSCHLPSRREGDVVPTAEHGLRAPFR